MSCLHLLAQLIDIPTRITDNTTSLIDLIFESNTDDVVCHGTLPQIADHEGFLVSYRIDSQKPKQKTRIIFDYKNSDIDGLIDYITRYDFNTVVFSQLVELQAELYSNVLTDAFFTFCFL